MATASSHHVTLAQVAAAARVSIATVSYALRGDRRIPEATATRVQEVARRLGYRPNPRVSSLMAHIRRARPVTLGERLAFLWIDAPNGERPYRKIFGEASRHAVQLGYAIEEFWRLAPGMSDHRLQQIISARGIAGLLISPSVTSPPGFRLDWDWSSFAPAVIGTAESIPELHHAAHHHYGAMRTAMIRLQAMDRRRIATILDRGIEERARRAWSAAFLAHHPLGRRAWAFLRQTTPDGGPGLIAWLRKREPEAVIAQWEILEPLLRHGWIPPSRTTVILLQWRPNRYGFGGIDQGDEVIAANAVDLVVNQLRNNERGIPDDVNMLLFAGRWVNGRQSKI